MTAEAPTGRPRVLVVYHADHAPLRTAIEDHLYAVGRYGDADVLYLNLAVRSIPAWVGSLGFDLVVLHTTLLAQRWHPPSFPRVVRRLRRLRGGPWRIVAIPQDEFIHSDALCALIRDLRVDVVLSCADEADRRTIYGDLVDGPTRFERVLTGYLDPATVERIGRLASAVGPRTVDVAYRAWRPEAWLGRHAQLKASIGDAFATAAPAAGLRTDISLRDEDTLIGDDWYRLLLRSRWTIGVEGGASILDRDGSLRAATLAYVATHPDASYEEIEAACFAGADGTLGLMAISPRHLEACATRTAQVLVEGDYNGVLEAEIHYLPLKRDLSNLPAVLTAMRDESLRERISDRAFRDVVASHRYDYRAFAGGVVGYAPPIRGRRRTLPGDLAFAWDRALDPVSWRWVRVRQRVRPRVRAALVALGLLGPLRRARAIAGGRG